MRPWLLVAVAVLAALPAGLAVDYAGELCATVVDFSLEDGTDFAQLDQLVENTYAMFPRWVTRDCLAALWKLSCMSTYGPIAADGAGYCRESCAATLQSCEKTLGLLPELQATEYTNLLAILCQLTGTTKGNCHTGAAVEYDDIPEDHGTVCPKPLGTIRPGATADTERIPGTACNTGCPAVILTPDEWDQLGSIATWCTLCSAVLSLVVIISHREEKNAYIRYLNLGTMSMNMMVFAFVIADEHVPQTCLEDGYYHKRSELCYIQAVVAIGGYIWMASWQACIAINLWLSVVVQAKRPVMEKVRSVFLPVATALAILSPAICLAGQNIGYDWAGYSGPVCLVLFSEDSTYYWALIFSPVALVVIVCLTLTIHTIFHVNSVLANSQLSNDSFFGRVGKMVKYNKRLVLFICCFAMMSGYHAGQILYENLSPDSTGFKSSAEEYIECLLEKTFADPHSGVEACGDKPKERPALWRVAMIFMYASTIGIMSFLVYGTQNKLQQTVSSSVQSLRSLRSGVKTTEAKQFVTTTKGSATDQTTPAPEPETSRGSAFMEVLRSSFVSISRLTGYDMQRDSHIQIEMAGEQTADVNIFSQEGETKE